MGSVNYIFANTGQTVRLVVQVLDSNGYPVDLDGYGNWLDGYGYLLPDGYYSDPPDGYYPDGYDGYLQPRIWTACVRHTTDRCEWNRWWGYHDSHNCFDDNCFDRHHCNDHRYDCFHINYRGANDGYYVPVVQQVIFPDFAKAAYYPRPMTRIGTGLYIHGLCIPNGVPSIGTYIVGISWMEKVQNQHNFEWETYAINASRPFGVTSVTPV